MPILDTSRIRGSQFRPLMRFSFWAFVVCFFILMFIGSQHVEQPYVFIGQCATSFYFAWFIVIVPVIGIVENTLMDISQDSYNSNDATSSTTYNSAEHWSTTGFSTTK